MMSESEKDNSPNIAPHRRHLSRRAFLATLLGVGVAAAAAAGGYLIAERGKENMPTASQEAQEIESEGNLLNHGWNYMPGTVARDGKLAVRPYIFSLVEQDGALSHTNAPVNSAGTYLDKLSGDFAVIADMQNVQNKTAILQLYGKSPIVTDEFRVERESVRFKLENNKLFVDRWDGQKQDPVIREVFDFQRATNAKLRVVKNGDKLKLSINGSPVGELPAGNVFDAGQVLFGLDTRGGEWHLASLRAEKLNNGSFVVADSSTNKVTKHDPEGLQLMAAKKRPGFIIGTSVSVGPLATDREFAAIALDKNMLGGLTTENELKMINTQPQPYIYDFSKADAIIKLAEQNGITNIHGHALVFGEANPIWFNTLPAETDADKERIKNIMVDRIKTVVGRYKDKIKSWDVINEPLADYPEMEGGDKTYREHKWYQAMGKDYIVEALATAHQTNRAANLGINEFGLESDDERWDKFIAFLTELKPKLTARGVPIDKVVIGFQAHVYERADAIDPETLRSHIRQLAALGFKSQISELDVYSDDGDAVQAEQYAKILKVCLEEKSCIAYRTWIMSDRYNYWKDDDGVINRGKDGLYDEGMQPRPEIQRQMRAVLAG